MACRCAVERRESPKAVASLAVERVRPMRPAAVSELDFTPSARSRSAPRGLSISRLDTRRHSVRSMLLATRLARICRRNSLRSRSFPDDNEPYIRDLLALSRPSKPRPGRGEAIGAADGRGLADLGRAAGAFEEFINELVTRTFLMGLDAEAGRLRGFFRRLAAVPSRRHPTDKKFGPDKILATAGDAHRRCGEIRHRR